MKNTTKVMLSLLALGASAMMLTAQNQGNRPAGNDRPPRHEGPGGPGMDGPQRPPPPIIAVLDANQDGVIDATEIANASKALLQLDKDGDGQLTREELRPPRPEGKGEGRPPHGPPGEN